GTDPVTPLPVTELNPATSTRAMFFASAPFTMAAARGCSLERSRLATSCNRFDSSIPGWGITELSVGFPSVSVPVLSMMSVSTLPKISSASALRMRMPACAPRPVPTMIAMGVASPRAHGQATINTATAFTRACAKRGLGTGREPHGEGYDGSHDHCRNKVRRNALCEPLNRRPRPLRLADHLHNLRQQSGG